MNSAAVLFTNFGFSIKKILAIIITTLLLILMFPILAISSLGLPAMSFLANAPSAKAAEERGFYNGGVMPGNTYAWGNCTWWVYAMRRWANSPIPNTWATLIPGTITPSVMATSSTIHQRLVQFFRLMKALMGMLRM